jgi:hypothetical protein
MGVPVVSGADIVCSFGSKPGKLVVAPTARVSAEGKPMATIVDSKPLVNIAPFGLCSSLGNPVTASQTSAAWGALTPGPCAPQTAAGWKPGSTSVTIGGKRAIDVSCSCACTYGGVITVANPGATKETVA